MPTSTDVIVIGAGIIGAACANELALQGLSVRVIDAHMASATNAGMGHLVVMDTPEAEMTLSAYSMPIWHEWAKRMCADDPQFQYAQCGTMWIASNEAEMAEAERKHQALQAAGFACELLNRQALSEAEPALKQGLSGGLEVKGDGLIYAPDAAAWLLHESSRIQQETGCVNSVDDHGVILADGRRFDTGVIVLATGVATTTLCPEIRIIPKKGHLAITDRYPNYIHHQLVELGYITRAHESSGTSVAFNAQPRPTGQIFLGSSRQFDSTTSTVDLPVLSTMLAAAIDFLPGMADFTIIRTWTGCRPATEDGMPLIGQHPWRHNVWLAVGHEGLGVTTAPATAKLLAAQIMNHQLPFDDTPFHPKRLVLNEVA